MFNERFNDCKGVTGVFGEEMKDGVEVVGVDGNLMDSNGEQTCGDWNVACGVDGDWDWNVGEHINWVGVGEPNGKGVGEPNGKGVGGRWDELGSGTDGDVDNGRTWGIDGATAVDIVGGRL